MEHQVGDLVFSAFHRCLGYIKGVETKPGTNKEVYIIQWLNKEETTWLASLDGVLLAKSRLEVELTNGKGNGYRTTKIVL